MMTPSRPPRCFALVPCAGTGSRAAAAVPKQYVRVAGKPVVAWTLAALAAVSRIEAVLVVLAEDDERFVRDVAAVDAGCPAWIARCGGATRAASVANGLAELAWRGAAADDWVLVHDAARCLVDPARIDALIDACLDDPVGGLLALPVGDTLKEEGDGRSLRTLDRRGKWLAQTPQMFRLGLLADALAQAGDAVTDEAAAVEALGRAPKLVPGDALNLKITWPQDLAFAERWLALQRAAAGASKASARSELRAFVPARDFDRSRRFYAELGFVETWCEGGFAGFRDRDDDEAVDAAFLLQDFHVPAHAENFVMQLLVDDLDAWWRERVESGALAERWGVHAEPPALRPWGLRDLALIDPTGVLWRVTER